MDEILAQLERGEQAAEKRAMEKNLGRIDNVLPAYDHIPGKRGSGGIWARGGEKEFGGGFGIMGVDSYAQTANQVDIIADMAAVTKPPRSSQIMDQPQAGQ
jgi:hypothetical protein